MTTLGAITPSPRRPLTQLGVIGCGLMGGSIALAAQAAGQDVIVYDADPATRARAAAAGLTVARSPGAATQGRDLVVLATPVDTLSTLAPEVRPYLEPGCLVTEIGSVKTPARTLCSVLGSEHTRVIPTNPMAGSAHTGFSHASAELLAGATWLVCAPPADEDARRLAAWVDALGAGATLAVSLEAHDATVAVVSHLPQLTASLLAATVGAAEAQYAPGALAAAGTGFRDATRLAESSFTMWGPIVDANRALVAMLLHELAACTEAVAVALDQGEDAALAAAFAAAQATRARWHEARPTRPADRPTPAAPEVRAPWEDPETGAKAWLDRSLGWETVRTTCDEPAAHAAVAACYLGAGLGFDPAWVRTQLPADTTGRQLNFERVAAALQAVGAPVQPRRTYTADGLHVGGVVLDDGRFIVIA